MAAPECDGVACWVPGDGALWVLKRVDLRWLVDAGVNLDSCFEITKWFARGGRMGDEIHLDDLTLSHLNVGSNQGLGLGDL
jgi:hypothetical protein